MCPIAIAAGVVGILALAKALIFRRRFRRFGGGGFGGGPWAYAGSCGGGPCGHRGGRGGYDEDDAYGGGPWDGPNHHDRDDRDRGPWGRRGFGGGLGASKWLRALFGRLDTTPGQEREIRSAIEDFQKAAREAKDGVKGAREDLAKAIASEAFDEIAMGEANVRVDNAALQMKHNVETTLKRVHAVLDQKQRERLADLIAKGPFGRGSWGSPYRG